MIDVKSDEFLQLIINNKNYKYLKSIIGLIERIEYYYKCNNDEIHKFICDDGNIKDKLEKNWARYCDYTNEKHTRCEESINFYKYYQICYLLCALKFAKEKKNNCEGDIDKRNNFIRICKLNNYIYYIYKNKTEIMGYKFINDIFENGNLSELQNIIKFIEISKKDENKKYIYNLICSADGEEIIKEVKHIFNIFLNDYEPNLCLENDEKIYKVFEIYYLYFVFEVASKEKIGIENNLLKINKFIDDCESYINIISKEKDDE